jgi:hypothetical protein
LTKAVTKYAKTVAGQVQSRSQSSGCKNLSELLSAFNFVTSGGRPGSVSDLSFLKRRGCGIVAFPGDPRPAAAIAASTDPIQQDPRFGEIRLRPDRIAFRKAVFGRHGVRCKISGCVEPALLDAAHLPGRDWKLGHNTAADGIPLRADLHRALDAGLIALDENYQLCWMDERLVEAYGDLLQLSANRDRYVLN